MEVMSLPRVSFDTAPTRAFEMMQARSVSAVVAVSEGRRFRLYPLPKVLKLIRDGKRSLGESRAGHTVHPLSLRDVDRFRLDTRDPYRTWEAFEQMLDSRRRFYAALSLELEPDMDMVVVVTRHEGLAGDAMQAPRWCSCSRKPKRHIWDYQEGKGGQACEFGDGGQVTCN